MMKNISLKFNVREALFTSRFFYDVKFKPQCPVLLFYTEMFVQRGIQISMHNRIYNHCYLMLLFWGFGHFFVYACFFFFLISWGRGCDFLSYEISSLFRMNLCEI